MPKLQADRRRTLTPVAQAAAGMLALSTPALAQDPAVPPTASAPASEEIDLLLGLRGVGETWQDPVVTRHYGTGRFSASAFMNAPLNGWLGLEIEAGYSKTPSEPDKDRVAGGEMELIPLSVDLVLRRDVGSVELFGGAGYAMAIFTETSGSESVSGVKPGVDFRVGTRVHTDLVRERLRPWGSSSVKGVDFELLVGRRQHHGFGMGTGFDLSAWRFGAGIVARL